MYDLVIKNGTIIDGSGRPMFKADVGIKEGQIRKIGFVYEKRAQAVIDATDLYITPGFIDVHNHSDNFWTLFLNPRLDSLLKQGVTTIMGGNCGDSLAPISNPKIIDEIQKWAQIDQVQINWNSLEEYLAHLEKSRMVLNYGTLIGHNTVRQGILGHQIREATVEEIQVMQAILRQSIQEGGFGLSTGLAFAPANTTSIDQLVELATVAGQEDAVYATHIRSESREVVRGVKEALEIAKKSGASLQISHLKVKEEKNWYKMDEILGLIEYAHKDGLNVNFDLYPYTAAGSVLGIYLPDWIYERGQSGLLEILKDPGVRQRAIKDMQSSQHDYSRMWIIDGPRCPEFINRNIVEIADQLRVSPEEAIVDIVLASENHALIYNDTISEDNIRKGVQSSLSMIASGGPGYTRDLISQSKGLVHPRTFGAFARLFAQYVKKDNLLSWEQAIRKVTSMPAEKFQLKKRGLIKKRYFADIAIFDPRELRDEASLENPLRYAWGMKHLLINGQFVVYDEQIVPDVSPGQVLKF